MPSATFDAGESRLLAYLSDALNPTGTGRNLFFAYHLDLTLHAQALADVLSSPSTASKSIAARADRRFFWNRVMAAPILDAGGDAFVLPMIVGSIGQLADVPAAAHGKAVALTLTLLARRSADRAGTRHWRRGTDTSGAAANFVETEQLVSLDRGRVVASYVQVRGSIPLLWSQIPNIKYKPTTRLLASGSPTSASFDAHFDALLAKYKGVSCVNLVNQKGSEGLLEAAFAGQAKRYASSRSAALTYTAFDFHKELGARTTHDVELRINGAVRRARALSVLWSRLQPEFARYGQFMTGTQHNSRQEGVFRVNCVDCLDRTNVVQGLLGRHALEALLAQLGVLGAGDDLATVLPQVEQQFKILWADHGDDIARQYAGTGALKSGFTRTGQRTIGGLLDDGVKSIVRYYLNNFQDGHKQDALDLMSGAYRVKRDVKLTFQRQHSPLVPVLAALTALGYAVTSATCLALAHNASGSSARDSSSSSNSSGSSGHSIVVALGQHVVAPLLLAAGLLLLIGRHGRMLVDRPQLCPQLAHTVAAAESSAAAKQH
ncbi:SacI homology domain-containing protein [Scenedesmus sp. NREL 46B-D3]|nr:SacI homology domain-containing protein [Scenedesmus sp. NREL 46B-D3]